MRIDVWTIIVGGVSLIFLGYGAVELTTGHIVNALCWLLPISTFYVFLSQGMLAAVDFSRYVLVFPAAILTAIQLYTGLTAFSEAVAKEHEVMQRELSINYDRGYPKIGTGKNLAKLYLACHRETMDALHTIHVASQAMKLPPEVSPVFGELAKSDRTEAEYKCE
jgi:hypothetical protein